MDAFKAEAAREYAKLRSMLAGLQHLASAKYALGWDQETGMPDAAAEERGATIGYLDAQTHDKIVSPEFARVIGRLNQLRDINGPSEERGFDAVVSLATRQFDRESKLPSAFVEELSALCASSQVVWKNAREQNSWDLFRPNLERLVEMKRQEAKYIGFADSPYDALIDYYEPGMTAKDADKLLGGLRQPLTDLVRRVGNASRIVRAQDGMVPAPISKQRRINRLVAERLGFDFTRGRLSETTHPFMTRLHHSDVRILTRYRGDDTLYGLGSTIHETGHGTYEQGLPLDLYGTLAGEVPSMGIHESQSRYWERIVGSSRAFCVWLHDILSECYVVPASVNALYAYFNAVTPSLIRTEADEVTYNLHICLRFEIGRALIEGSMEVAQVPEVWNEKMREYLGITPPTLAEGCLQDVHWSAGYFGYFPTYALGNVYSAQLHSALLKDIGGQRAFSKHVSKGEFAPILQWHREHVHQYGSLKSAAEIVRDATGQAPTAEHFIDYVTRKVHQTYDV